MGTQVIDDDVVQTNGVMLVDSETLDDDTARAISEVAQTRDGIRIRFHDKQAALLNIGRHLGMFVDNINNTSDDELIRRLLEGRARAFSE